MTEPGLVAPIDVVELVKVSLAGLTALLGAIAALFSILAARRGKRSHRELAQVKSQVARIEENTAAIADGQPPPKA